MKKTIKLTEIELKSFIKESIDKVINEIKKDRKKFNIDGAEYESASVKRGGATHPGYRWKDHETHNPENSKQYRKRKDGYRYAADYEGKPNTLHKNLTNKLKEDLEPDYYDGFVVLDGTEANLGNFETSYDAIDYARELASKNKYGTYYVYGTENNEYSEDTLIYDTDEDFQ